MKRIRTALVLGMVVTAVTVMAQAVAQRPKFEVASIRPSGQSTGDCGGAFPAVNPSRLTVSDATVYWLISSAYFSIESPVPCDFVNRFGLLMGGPSWIRSELFFVQAVMPAGSPAYTVEQFLHGKAETVQQMIQSLLADRFKLALHRETREIPVYALTVAKGGPKLQRLQEGDCVPRQLVSTNGSQPQTQPDKPLCGADNGIWGTGGANSLTARWSLSLREFCAILSPLLDRPVIDRTGITGMVKFTMVFAAAQTAPGLPSPVMPDTAVAALPSGAPSIFTAIQEQVGLKLEPTTGPVEVFVVDHIEHPTEN